MVFDATFWVAVSFVIFLGVLFYFKIPNKLNSSLEKMISDIKNEIDESEKLRIETKKLLENAENKFDKVKLEKEKIIKQAKKEGEQLIIELNEKFHKSAEQKKNSTKIKINQMKEAAIKDIKSKSIKLSVESVKKIISTSVDKQKLSKLFERNLEDTNNSLKKS
jgi:F-type H+-transporting ATPase subunit b|tara:strand:+ start:38 stop:529 length:492 start_codon:yes stop_codon:yes gene_type:complete